MTASFTIDRVVPRRDESVDVHVRWDGGGEIFSFPKSYPPSTILAQLKIEFRRREVEGGGADRHQGLLGKHDV